MTVEEWNDRVRREYTEAGFELGTFQGYPLIKIPPTFEGKVKFLEFKPTFSCTIRIYAEGGIVVPPGA